MSALAFALLADGRFPAGGHVHSAGMEAAIADGRVRTIEELEAFLVGRLHTAGHVDAALAAAAHRHPDALPQVDAEADVRIIVPSLRDASRRLGRQLVRAATRCWPCEHLATTSFHFPVALGAVAQAAGLDALGAACLAIHHAVTAPAQAAVRLLGLDPYAVIAVVARLDGDAVAFDAALLATRPFGELPAATGPITDIAAAAHAVRTDTLFAT